MLLEHHFQDVNNVVNALRDKGFIESDHIELQQKNSQKMAMAKQSLVFYHLKLDSEYASILV